MAQEHNSKRDKLFLNKAMSHKLSKEKGFGIEVFIEIDNESTRIRLKSIKDGNFIFESSSYYNFKLEDALNSAVQTLERHISNFEYIQPGDDKRLKTFLRTALHLRGNFENINEFDLIEEETFQDICNRSIKNTKTKEEALKYLNEYYDTLLENAVFVEV